MLFTATNGDEKHLFELLERAHVVRVCDDSAN